MGVVQKILGSNDGFISAILVLHDEAHKKSNQGFASSKYNSEKKRTAQRRGCKAHVAKGFAVGWRNKDTAALRLNNTVSSASAISPSLTTSGNYRFDVLLYEKLWNRNGARHNPEKAIRLDLISTQGTQELLHPGRR